MKQCIRCHSVKDLSDFYKHPQMRDGHLNKCKECARKDARDNKTVPRVCYTCAKVFMANANEVKRRGGQAYTCSRACYYRRLGIILEEKYSGAKLTYSSVHMWIKRVNGKPQECSSCGRNDDAALYQWSNISGEYRRDPSDWQRLCAKCHIRYDVEHQGKSDKFRATLARNMVKRTRNEKGQFTSDKAFSVSSTTRPTKLV